MVKEPRRIPHTDWEEQRMRELIAKIKMEENLREWNALRARDAPKKRYAKNTRRDCEFPKKSMYDVVVNVK